MLLCTYNTVISSRCHGVIESYLWFLRILRTSEFDLLNKYLVITVLMEIISVFTNTSHKKYLIITVLSGVISGFYECCTHLILICKKKKNRYHRVIGGYLWFLRLLTTSEFILSKNYLLVTVLPEVISVFYEYCRHLSSMG